MRGMGNLEAIGARVRSEIWRMNLERAANSAIASHHMTNNR
jgi:hypothetical protein